MKQVGAITPQEAFERAKKSIKNFVPGQGSKKPKGHSVWIGGAIKQASIEKVINEESDTFGMEFARIVLGNKGKNLRIKIPIGTLARNDENASGIMRIRDWVYDVEENPIPAAIKVNINYWFTKDEVWRPYFTLDEQTLQNIKILLDLSKSKVEDDDE